MTIAPDGRLYIAQKNGDVLIYDGENLLPTPFVSIDVDFSNERGLSGIAFHPNYEQNQWVYLYYTVSGANRNRLSRFTANGDVVLQGSEEILLELDPLAGTIHNGGAMEFGPDGKLYIAVGDGSNPENSQNNTTVLGKILRLNDDGSIPEDNPFYTQYSGNARAIFASGFRNPFTMDVSSEGRIFANDVGGGEYEEVNDVLAGANYGWTLIEGPIQGQTPPPGYQDPFYAYSHDLGCAIVGAAFYDPETLRFPARYHGNFFFADYCEGYIKVLDSETGDIIETFATNINRPLAMEFRSDGQMFLLERAGIGGGSNQDNQSSDDGALWLISFVDNGKPFIGRQPESVTVPIGETVSFSVNASGDQPLTYSWEKNGLAVGENSSELTLENVQLSDDGAIIRCIVSNASGSVISENAILNVTSNQRPAPVIVTPDASLTYGGGQLISFSGTATDPEDGALNADAFTWWVDFHHNTHTHPAVDPVTGITEGEFAISQVGEISENVWYRIYLQVTDSEGLTQTVFREIFPRTSTVTIDSNPEGLLINVDGKEVSAPYSFTGVEGILRSVSPVKAQRVGNTLYVFDGWEDGFAQQIRTYATPEEDSSFVINYKSAPVGDGKGLKGEYYNQSRTFDGEPTLVRTDEVVDFDWGGESPDELINDDNFTARWTGKIVPQFTENYRLYVVADDGVRLYLNGNMLINAWVPQGATEYGVDIVLSAGVPYDLVVEYFEDGGAAVIKLLWESETLPKAVIPTEQMYISSVTGIEEEEEIHIYPNPAQQQVTVITSGAETIQVLDTQGRVLIQATASRSTTLDLSKVTSGIYLVRITTPTGSMVRKLIVD